MHRGGYRVWVGVLYFNSSEMWKSILASSPLRKVEDCTQSSADIKWRNKYNFMKKKCGRILWILPQMWKIKHNFPPILKYTFTK